ncbi:MAG: 4-(cytidine 5'-diphospho)-2-C-methyl-D-erythritol kinase [Acidobacteriia bacterium]|nr:4-(cytidine 5'-diphospho)-2-C-methyl-D-erythritol kinase [Terriglobia bacterium]
MSAPRRARLKAYAKVNLSLLVGKRRQDGFHELRTVFQTVSLGDVLEVEYRPGGRRRIELESSVAIADNIVARAADRVMQTIKAGGELRIRLDKRVPMGGGLGGGSSDAAAVLLALPALAGVRLSEERLHGIAVALGSDVPFFLMGGTALGLGRGEELYPLPSLRGRYGLLVIPPVAVSTAEAYQALNRPMDGELTGETSFHRMKGFQSFARAMASCAQGQDWKAFCENDFEAVVFRRYPLLPSLQRKLRRLGAWPARMSGSGSTLFGLFASREERDRAQTAMSKMGAGLRLKPMSFVSRERYQAEFVKALAPPEQQEKEKTWPPRSQYEE